MIKTPHLRMHRLSTLLVLLFCAISASAQVPTTADCLGAIPICQNQYSYNLSPSGSGNYPNEINNVNSCLGTGELNDTWYTFTVQQSGNLCFSITPNASSDDYDWAVYNLTTNNCSDIYNNGALEVSCNYDPAPGVTGPNGQSGPQNEPCIPVTAGQTYVINVSNFSSTTNGYTINFAQSSAVIFDQVPPQLLSISGQGCNSTTLTVTFTENILCNTVQASDFSLPGYTVTNVTSPACAAGGTYDNSYTLTISPALSAGSYTMNMAGPVTDLCGNPLQLPASLGFNINGLSTSVNTTPSQCGQQTGSATVTPTGTGPFTYSWSPNVGNTATVNNLAAGSYTVTVTDAAGCSTVDTAVVAATGGNISATVTSQSNALCNNQCNGSVTVSGSGGTAPYTYSWNTSPVQNTPTAANLCAGSYTVTVTDATGCQTTQTVTITQPPAMTLSSSTIADTCGQLTGSATVTPNGTGPFSYSWNPNVGTTATVNNLASGSYTVTVTDASGCTASDTLVVASAPGNMTVNIASQNNVLCNGQCTGSVTVSGNGGTAPYTYSWNTTPVQNTATATNLCAGTYSVTVSDAGGCTTIQSVTLTEPALLTLATSTDNAACGQPNGEASVTPQGGTSPYTYSWNTAPAQTTATATGLAPGQYIVTVTDANGCNQTAVAIVSNTTSFNTSVQSTDVSCEAEMCDGSALVAPSGGTAPYTFIWSDSLLQSTPTANGLCAGTYTVVITDANGCTATDSVTVNECPPAIPEFTFYAPNTFTPNGDGKNDVFMGYGTFIQNYDLMIFDRWGDQIFRTDDLNKWWDGKANGGSEIAQEDVYIYVVNLTDFNNKKHKFIGHVTLIK